MTCGFFVNKLPQKGKRGGKINSYGIATDALNRVAAAAAKMGRLEPRIASTRAELHAAIRDAHREGATVTLIANVSGLSRQRVDQLVKQPK